MKQYGKNQNIRGATSEMSDSTSSPLIKDRKALLLPKDNTSDIFVEIRKDRWENFGKYELSISTDNRCFNTLRFSKQQIIKLSDELQHWLSKNNQKSIKIVKKSSKKFKPS